MPRKPIHFEGSRTVGGQVADFAALLDPQNWSKNVGWLWQASALVVGDLPADRNEDPEVEAVSGDWPPRRFFEDVVFGFVSHQRNILMTSYTAAPTQVTFRYAQYECLNSVFFGQESFGGIDVDKGEATCVPAGADQVTLSISKSVRFTQPSNELEIVDLVSAVSVYFVMELLLLGVGW